MTAPARTRTTTSATAPRPGTTGAVGRCSSAAARSSAGPARAPRLRRLRNGEPVVLPDFMVGRDSRPYGAEVSNLRLRVSPDGTVEVVN